MKRNIFWVLLLLIQTNYYLVIEAEHTEKEDEPFNFRALYIPEIHLKDVSRYISSFIFETATTPQQYGVISMVDNDSSFIILPTGTGAFLLQIPDEKIGGGNIRGEHAVDLQRDRTDPSQVASGGLSVIAGGSRNTASAINSTVSGGDNNSALALHSVVSGGQNNRVSGTLSTIGGGYDNRALGNYSVIGGGVKNSSGTSSGGSYTTVAGGLSNNASAPYSTISGGNSNVANNQYAAVGGGNVNIAAGQYSCISGGSANSATGDYGSIGGGYLHTASGNYSTVPGGYFNTASGAQSFAAGTQAQAINQGSFVLTDSQPSNFASSDNDQFSARFQGGYKLQAATSSSKMFQITNASGAPIFSVITIGKPRVAVQGDEYDFDIFSVGLSSEPRSQLLMGYHPTGNYGAISATTSGVSYRPLILQRDGGTLSIRTLATTNTVEVGGNVHASGFPTSSDSRLKKNIRYWNLNDKVLERVMKLKPCNFDWNDRYPAKDQFIKESKEVRQVGFVAQEVEELFPELVTQWSFDHREDAINKGLISRDSNAPEDFVSDYRALDYSRMVAVLCRAIQEQQYCIEEQSYILKNHDEIIRSFDKEISYLRKIVERLKNKQ